MKFQRRRSPDASVDLTPLIDVVFLLLIFFMVTTTFVREGRMSLELPQADTEVITQPTEPVQVLVSREGDYTVNGRTLVDRAVTTLVAALRDAAAGDTEQPMVITADGRAPHQAVVSVMDAAERVGFEKVRIAIEPEGDAAP
ncbi:MAG TPA: biopolymer transporter ExbD [Pseudomonadales bacterium]|nr:biopolymer transporter ExbD [Pseudomonadales bacterium]